EAFFKTFTTREVCDTSRQTEALIALSCESRTEVDGLVKKAIDAGGRDAKPAQDHGFMYGRSFYDLDGHHWEVMWMDPKGGGVGAASVHGVAAEVTPLTASEGLQPTAAGHRGAAR